MKKSTKNWTVFLTIALAVIGTWIAYGQYQLNVQTNRASIDYGISTNGQSRFYAFENTVNVWCNNGGGMDGKFYLVVSLTNATLSEQQSYKVNSTIVKIPFVLHKSGADGDSSNLNIAFTPDTSVSGFSVLLSFEKRDNNPLVANSFTYNPLQCEWNNQERCFQVVG